MDNERGKPIENTLEECARGHRLGWWVKNHTEKDFGELLPPSLGFCSRIGIFTQRWRHGSAKMPVEIVLESGRSCACSLACSASRFKAFST
jgi:hypothetical protein